MKTLRVYGWSDFRDSVQTREIVAATSRAAAARVTHRLPYQLFNLCETANNEERRIALATPGVIHWCPLDESYRSNRVWRK